MSSGGHAAFEDGQTAERAKLDPLDFVPEAPKVAPRHGSELHLCATCGSGLVYLIDWAPADERNWAVELRCPDCEWVGNGVYSQATVDMFDVELDRATDVMIEDLARLTRANMEEEIDRFIVALAGDHILPEDF